MELNICKVQYNDIKLKRRDAEKLRGYIGNKYIDNTLLHNHSEDKFIYRYPLVQYKVINNTPIIIGINEGANDVAKIGLLDDELVINDKKIETFQKEISKSKEEIGCSNDYVEYEFITPWIALSQKNINSYSNGSEIAKEELIKKILIGNIISMSKGLDYTVNDRVHCWVNLREVQVNLKGKKHIGFLGVFKINFNIPNYLGIGKSVARGFGTIRLK